MLLGYYLVSAPQPQHTLSNCCLLTRYLPSPLLSPPPPSSSSHLPLLFLLFLCPSPSLLIHHSLGSQRSRSPICNSTSFSSSTLVSRPLRPHTLLFSSLLLLSSLLPPSLPPSSLPLSLSLSSPLINYI